MSIDDDTEDFYQEIDNCLRRVSELSPEHQKAVLPYLKSLKEEMILLRDALRLSDRELNNTPLPHMNWYKGQ